MYNNRAISVCTTLLIFLFLSFSSMGCDSITSPDTGYENELVSANFSDSFNKNGNRGRGNSNNNQGTTSESSDLESVSYCTEQSFTLTAGQHHNAGSVVIKIEENTIYITYLAASGWTIQKTHMHIAKDLDGVPTNRAGVPVIGHFTYSESHDNVTVVNYSVTFEEAGLSVGDTFIVVTHAEVRNGTNGKGETAFGGNKPGDGPRWWFYAQGDVEECEEDEPIGGASVRFTRTSRW